MTEPATLVPPIHAICFDWGGTLMIDDGPDDLPMVQWPTVTAVDGAAACLAALFESVPLYVATNATASSRAMIEQALERVKLRRFFSGVFCFTEIGFRKNQPEFWYRIQQLIDEPLHNIAIVGDSLENDVLAPRSLGVQAVWFNPTGQQSAAPVPTITSLASFADLVSRTASKTARFPSSTVIDGEDPE
jgi:FMN phosphatase YigB (HAD superfamily)